MNEDQQQAGEQVDIVFDGLVLDLSESLSETIVEPDDSAVGEGVEKAAEAEPRTESAASSEPAQEAEEAWRRRR